MGLAKAGTRLGLAVSPNQEMGHPALGGVQRWGMLWDHAEGGKEEGPPGALGQLEALQRFKDVAGRWKSLP